MENLITIKDYKLIKETEKAVLLNIENKNFWFPKSKIKINADSIEMNKDFYEENINKEVKEIHVEVFLLPENYSDKVYKFNVEIEKGTYKTVKYIFVPKSKVYEIKVESTIIPKWIWNNSLEEILQKEVEYYNRTYEDQITAADYKINVDVVEL